MLQREWISNVLCSVNSVSKGYILFDSIYMTFWERQKCRNREQTSGFQGSKVRRGSDYGLARNSVHLTKAQNRNGYLAWRGRDGAWTPRGIFMGTDQTVSKYTSTHSESPPIYLYAVGTCLNTARASSRVWIFEFIRQSTQEKIINECDMGQLEGSAHF